MAGAKLVLTIKRLSDFFLPYFITILQDTLDLQSPRTLTGFASLFPSLSSRHDSLPRLNQSDSTLSRAIAHFQVTAAQLTWPLGVFYRGHCDRKLPGPPGSYTSPPR